MKKSESESLVIQSSDPIKLFNYTFNFVKITDIQKSFNYQWSAVVWSIVTSQIRGGTSSLYICAFLNGKTDLQPMVLACFCCFSKMPTKKKLTVSRSSIFLIGSTVPNFIFIDKIQYHEYERG